MEQWMESPARNRSPTTNGTKLLEELHAQILRRPSGSVFPRKDYFFTGDTSCVRIFGLLLRRKRGHLIDIFHRSKTYDKVLDLRRNQYDADHPALRQQLRYHNISQSEMDSIIEEFEHDRWEFCPPLDKLKLHGPNDFDHTQVILPFCRRTPINNKGGTAKVSWVTIQKDLVTDTGMREALQNSEFQDELFGSVSEVLSLKSVC